MKRIYKKRPLFEFKKLGQVFFTLFVVFIAYRILTPPSEETARLVSPDGSMLARLRTFYYYDDLPSYKIYYRKADDSVWRNLHYVPAYTNTPVHQTKADIAWTPDSSRLDFLINGSSVWHHVFSP